MCIVRILSSFGGYIFPSSFPLCHSHQLLFFFAVSFQGCFNDQTSSRFEACGKLVASRLQDFSRRAVSLRKTTCGSFVTSITHFFAITKQSCRSKTRVCGCTKHSRLATENVQFAATVEAATCKLWQRPGQC